MEIVKKKNSKIATVLVTGGSGFIGKHLIKNSKIKKWNIVSLSINKKLNYKNITEINLDIVNKKLLFEKLNHLKIDYIINLAGHINHYEKKKTFDTHFKGCKNLIDFAVKKKVKRFIQIGSSVEYGFLSSPVSENTTTNIKNLKSTYGKAKLKASNYLIKISKKTKLKYLILRPFLIYGPGQTINRLIPNIITNSLKDKNFPCSLGNQIRDFLYIDDFVDFIIECVETKKVYNEIFNVGSDKPIKVRKVINSILNITKKGRPLYGKVLLRKDEPLKLYPNLKKTFKYFKWKPKTILTNGLVKTINYYKRLNNKKNK